jgi:tryptophan 7-halogenase
VSEGIKSIIIVGGGTAGWLSAAYLQKALGKVEITVVESDDVGIIGVGEATIPSIRATMQVIDIPEWRFFKATDATFKNGIRFMDWLHSSEPGGARHEYFHPFEQGLVGEGHTGFAHYMALKAAGEDLPPMWDTIGVQSTLSRRLQSPKLMASPPYDGPVAYAYHLDAVKFGRLLREVGTERGVTRIVDHVTDVRLNEGGDIAAILTRDGRELSADFFIDCTGFRGLLIEQALKEPFRSYSDMLLCDRAVACQTPHPAAGRTLRPYTTSTAQSAGWTWEIDLIDRRGTGYVYSTRFISDEDAERELLAHLGVSREGLSPRVLDMRVGRRDRIWVGNCLAVGLSAGFIEPLESTGIYFIEMAAGLLVDYAPRGQNWEALRRKVNEIYREAYDQIAEFVLLHYILNRRDGLAFWDAYRNEVAIPQRLAELLELWRRKLPSKTDLEDRASVFGPPNWTSILVGMGYMPEAGGNLAPYMDLARSRAFLAGVAQMRETATKVSPPHDEILQKLRAVAP